MKSYLMILEQQNQCPNYHNFLSNVESEAKRQGGIECLSRNVYMIPEKKFLPFVSEVGVQIKVAANQGGSIYKYKCLTVEEDAQWLRFDGYQQS